MTRNEHFRHARRHLRLVRRHVRAAAELSRENSDRRYHLEVSEEWLWLARRTLRKGR